MPLSIDCSLIGESSNSPHGTRSDVWARIKDGRNDVEQRQERHYNMDPATGPRPWLSSFPASPRYLALNLGVS